MVNRRPHSSLEAIPVRHFVAFVLALLALGLLAALLPGV
jgi:hypothetical protein